MMNKFVFTNSISAGATEDHVVNLAKLMSSANRKQFHNVNNKGIAQNYTIAVTPMSTAQALSIWTAPNNYVTKRAVKAAHDARAKMFRRAGIRLKDLNAYGRTLRPYFNPEHERGTLTEAGFLPGYSGDEWTYSLLATSTPAEAAQLSSQTLYFADLVDTYPLTLTGGSVRESNVADDPDESSTTSEGDKYRSAGIIDGWLVSFRKRATADHAEEIIDPDNWLLQLGIDSASSEEVLEIVEDQDQEQPPWDGDGAAYVTQMFADYIVSTSHQSPRSILQVPCGLLEFRQENFHTSTDNCHVKIEVLAIEDM